jgi:myo-inositol-1(or 4)-monophosphatase
MFLPWLKALPESLPAPAVEEFVQQFCQRSETLLERQDEAVQRPAAVVAIEWDLEEQLLGLISEAFGPARVLAEEYFGRHRREIRAAGPLRFVLDPLDGSASYARSSPRFTTSLAISVDGYPTVALVFHPATHRLYSALAGHGCYLNDRRLTRGPELAPRIAVVKMQWAAREPVLAERMRRMIAHGYQLERMESTSLKLCWTAERRRAGLLKWLSYAHGQVLEWGTLAGVLICAEMGMTAHRMDGAVWAGHPGGLIIGDDRYLADIGSGPVPMDLGEGDLPGRSRL